MEINANVWKSSTSKVFNGVLLFSLSGIVGGIVAAIAAFSGSLGAALWVAVLAGLATYFRLCIIHHGTWTISKCFGTAGCCCCF